MDRSPIELDSVQLTKLDNKLRLRLRIYTAVAIIILGIVMWRMVQGTLGIPTVLITIIVGLRVGGLFSRIDGVDLDAATGEVTGVLDKDER